MSDIRKTYVPITCRGCGLIFIDRYDYVIDHALADCPSCGERIMITDTDARVKS